MTKQDLRTGMVVVTRNGNKYVVLKELGCLSRVTAYTALSKIREDLTCEGDYYFDIVEVYVPNGVASLDTLLVKKGTLIWKREEVKELTVSEIEKILGYPVKIVKE